MIEILKEKIKTGNSYNDKLNLIREFLQILILKIMFDKNHFNYLSFQGGTALRILFNLRRFSEDLDFSLINKKNYVYYNLISEIEKELKLFGFNIESKIKDEKTIQNAIFKFPQLLKELGLSNLSEQKLSVRLEIDTNPPKGWKNEISFVNNIYIFTINHFDLPSLFATKLHACFYRKYVKGRDFYDLIWYLSNNIEPNFILLNNAIKQTDKNPKQITKNNFKSFLLKRIEQIDFKLVKKDVERFLEDKNEIKLFDYKTVKNLIEKIAYSN